MKKYMIWFLAAAMVLSLMTVTGFAEESEEPVPREPGFCGETVKWSYAEGVLTLEGSGRTDDFYAGQPWQDYRNEIREVRLSGGITYLGAYAFPDYDALTTVYLGGSLIEIGQGAFSGCDGLTEVSLPATFRIFGEESFSHCSNLKEFHFEGVFPKFKLNCMWDTYAKLYYPAERPWPLQHIMDLEEAFQGRIEFLASDGSDPYVEQPETEPTEVPTTAETEEPFTEATLPAATEITAVLTEATEVPTTEVSAETAEPTVAPNEAPETRAPVTEPYVELPEEDPPTEDDSLLLAGLIGMAVVSGGLALFLIGKLSHNSKKDFAGDFSEILLEDERKGKKKPTQAQKAAQRKKPRKGGKYSR